MTAKNDLLVLFTAEFPYGNSQETFLETEIHYLCDVFKKVIIIPGEKKDTIRALPKNAVCEDVLCQKAGRFGFVDLIWVLSFFFRNVFFENKVRNYFYYLRSVIYVLKGERKKFKALHSLISSLPDHAIYYDYWYINSTLPLIWLKRIGLVRTIVCRAHGYDLYDERSFAGVILFRRYIAKNVNHVFFISKYGLSYFRDRVPSKIYPKLSVSYLGVESAKSYPIKADSSRCVVISISRLVPLKRVEKIVEVLEHFSRPVTWIHFGGGEEYVRIKDACEKMKNPMVQWSLRGSVDNAEIEDFLECTNISASILLSKTEGIPVSIMEVIRYGIPVIATNLPSMVEIINSETGMLVELDESPETIARKLEILCDYSAERRMVIINFFEKRFNAKHNYTDFTNQLLTIVN